MQRSIGNSAQQHEAGTALRALTALAGLVGISLGALGLVAAARLAGVYEGLGDAFTGHQLLNWLVYALVFLSIAAAGASLLWSAWRKRSHNLVPGPTLYVLGASLAVLGMYRIVLGEAVFAIILIALGGLIMLFEYRSVTI